MRISTATMLAVLLTLLTLGTAYSLERKLQAQQRASLRARALMLSDQRLAEIRALPYSGGKN